MRVETLRSLLEQGHPITILDVRPEPERQDWAIPNSLFFPGLYEAVNQGNEQALDAVALPTDQLIVVVCGAGKTSQHVAALLRARGYQAESLEGGMRAWSFAWNVARTVLADGTVLYQVRRVGKGCLSYLLVAGGKALIIDPAIDAAVFAQLAAAEGAQIIGVAETHLHADHLSRAPQLVTRFGVPRYLGVSTRAHFPVIPLDDGATITIGPTTLRVLATPGHTWESISFWHPAGAVFTGDTLFLEGIGRVDLEAHSDEALHRAQALVRSLQRLQALPAETLVFPGHTAQPPRFDGQPLCASLGTLREHLPLLQVEPSALVDHLLAHQPEPPAHFAEIVALNLAGAAIDDPEQLATLEAGANRCAVR
ncbi:MBL fold metallo-hydrolase [Thermorudis peleae]|uniref:MBL fold metallo-hydrolase n=1 Tax=Thermorudis peleae TaxID=1382356 RepID=UPI0005704D51|nr:MBL fold metallo-hydrolase [Thermorudis peleae]